jgi:regulator of RNase E activity RraB
LSRTPAYPNDADGDALRRVAADGSDMSRPMEIDFAVAVPSQAAGERVAAEAKRLGFTVKLVPDACEEEPDASSWSCYCTKTMVPEYDSLLDVQRQLNDIAAPCGGWSDGWGTFGNGPKRGGKVPS